MADPTVRLTIDGTSVEVPKGTMLIEAAKQVPRVLSQPEPEVFFLGFGDSTLDYEVRVYVAEYTNRARTEVIHELHRRIDKTFRQHGVVIAFPQRDVHLYTTSPAPGSNEPGSAPG